MALFLGACEYQECDVNPETGNDAYFGKRLDCDGAVCTMNFVSINVDVANGSGAAVLLDSFVVTDRNGNALRSNANGLPVFGTTEKAGTYTVMNDGWVRGHEGIGGNFLAKGYLNGAVVFNEPYKITADCCHVTKISGKDRIIVP